MMGDDLYESANKRIGELSVLLNGAETAAESHRIAAETWSARAVEAEAKLEAARQKIESLRVEAGNNHAAAASWMDQHDGLAKRMIDVQDENKRLHTRGHRERPRVQHPA
jgi:chromosome segregation ATPase